MQPERDDGGVNATLILADGTVYRGRSMGAEGDRICELVFNTSMAGYQEILTDPSYAGQGIVMTYPLIGNYGINTQDEESRQPWAEAYVVRHLSPRGSNFRLEGELDAYLKRYNIPGICEVDTRALTRRLRGEGVMNALLTTREDVDIEAELPKIRAYRVQGTVEATTRRQPQHYENTGFKVAMLDLGVKESMIRSLHRRGCDVTVYPATTPAAEILAGGYDGMMLSNGPGDPADCTAIIAEIRKLYENATVPIFAVCMGHQLMALATGAKTARMKFGHRGANHPVRDLADGRCYVTSQNHGYMVLADSVNPEVAEISHINVNDGSVEGLRYKNGRVFTVQFHPEASPGPQDTAYLFDRFISMMEENHNA